MTTTKVGYLTLLTKLKRLQHSYQLMDFLHKNMKDQSELRFQEY